jgi:hypothetical protein
VLGARPALAHGLERDAERARDLLGREPAQGAQGEADLGVERQRRVATGEDQLEPLVRECRRLGHRLLHSFFQLAAKRSVLTASVWSRRMRSIARLRAIVISQPVGFFELSGWHQRRSRVPANGRAGRMSEHLPVTEVLYRLS